MTRRAIFDIPQPPLVPITGVQDGYEVRRIFCVGRNYAAHAAEMGHDVDREAPFYFTKAPSAICSSGQTIPYPAGTDNYHHEMEFVVALGAPAFRVPAKTAMAAVYGYACGFDMTRRDRQQDGKDKRRPWDLGKDVENSAVIGPITPALQFGIIADQTINLTVNNDPRQTARLSDMVWSVAEIIAHLSGYYHLGAGDLIYTGTPAGVGPVEVGDVLHGTVTGLSPVDLEIGARET